MHDMLVAFGDESTWFGFLSRNVFEKLELGGVGDGANNANRIAPLVCDASSLKQAVESEPFGMECHYLGARLLVLDAAGAIAFAAHPKNCLFLTDPYLQIEALSQTTDIPVTKLYTRLHQAISFSERTSAGELDALISLTNKHAQNIHFSPFSPFVPHVQAENDSFRILLTVGERCVPPMAKFILALVTKLPDIPIVVCGIPSMRSEVERISGIDGCFVWVEETTHPQAVGASVHLHCGLGQINGVGSRFLDSWNLKRPIVQFIDPTYDDSKLKREIPTADQIINDGRTGLLCRSSQEVMARLAHLKADRNFTELVVDRAHSREHASNDAWLAALEDSQ